MQHKFYIYREKRGLGHPETAALVKKAAAAALRAEGVDEPCEIGVTLTNDEGIHAINREQRGVDRPTDVLSFPIDEMDYDTNRRYLGDMVLSLERAEAQGEEYGGGFSTRRSISRCTPCCICSVTTISTRARKKPKCAQEKKPL